jgi:hypothetical protein
LFAFAPECVFPLASWRRESMRASLYSGRRGSKSRILRYDFPEFGTYHGLVNPSDPLIRAAPGTLVKSGDRIFLATTSGQDVAYFGVECG